MLKVAKQKENKDSKIDKKKGQDKQKGVNISKKREEMVKGQTKGINCILEKKKLENNKFLKIKKRENK